MARLGKALALFALLAAWFIPAQVAFADSVHPNYQKSAIAAHQEDEDESESEDENDSEDDDEDGDDGGGKQFAPPPLVVKHKGQTTVVTPSDKVTSAGKGSKALKGVVPSSSANLVKAASLGIVTLEQAFSGTDYVTSAVQPVSPSNDPNEADENHSQPGDAVNPEQNEPVVNNIGLASYEDPATEFMHKAYFGLAVLGAGAVAMGVHTISRTRAAAKVNESDYDYEGKSDA